MEEAGFFRLTGILTAMAYRGGVEESVQAQGGQEGKTAKRTIYPRDSPDDDMRDDTGSGLGDCRPVMGLGEGWRRQGGGQPG